MTETAPYLPERFADVAALEDFMTAPSPELAADLARAPGDLLILGVGGKMGPTLARLRASAHRPARRVIGVARFTDTRRAPVARRHGRRDASPATCSTAHAIATFAARANVIFMAGHKFGAADNPGAHLGDEYLPPGACSPGVSATRASSRSPPAACTRFVDVASGGAYRGDAALPPPGEYAISCVGRERMFVHFSARVAARPAACSD